MTQHYLLVYGVYFHIAPDNIKGLILLKFTNCDNTNSNNNNNQLYFNWKQVSCMLQEESTSNQATTHNHDTLLPRFTRTTLTAIISDITKIK